MLALPHGMYHLKVGGSHGGVDCILLVGFFRGMIEPTTFKL